jgi:carboxyl-terminal processing protease
VTQVRPGSPAENAGVQAGEVVLKIGNVPVSEAVARRLEGNLCGDEARARDWALLAVLAGRRGEERLLEVRSRDGTVRAVDLRGEPGDGKKRAPVETLRTGEGGRYGVIRFNDSLGEAEAAYAAIAAVRAMQDTDGMIIDLRETPGGGNTVVARAILGLFVEREAPYQKHELVEEERRYQVRRAWLELVSPLAVAHYAKPVVVLVSRWTGSMVEGLAQGFRATGRGRVVGTRMAGLRGAISAVTLPKSGFVVQIPTERLFAPDGTPREAFLPDVPVDPGSEAGEQRDVFLEAALNALSGVRPVR